MNNLDWSNVEDEKDKRIRELEDTLRKQKELMEILQVLGKNASISKSCFVLRGNPFSNRVLPRAKLKKNHNFQILFCSQRKMQLAEEEDQPNSLPESDEIPDL